MARKKEESNETNINDKQSKNEGKDKEKVKDKKATRTEGEVVQKKRRRKIKVRIYFERRFSCKNKKIRERTQRIKRGLQKINRREKFLE